MKLKIAFYNGYSGSWYNKFKQFVVKRWTGGPFGHVELIQVEDGLEDDPDHWIWYGATSHNPGGVVRRKLDHNPDNWDIFDLAINESTELNLAIIFLMAQLGKEFDWIGIYLSHFIKISVHEKKQFFCSEYVAEALQKTNLLYLDTTKPHEYSPNSLYRKLKKLGVI